MKWIGKPHQLRAKNIIIRDKRKALHMDVGSGKTTTTAVACSELLDDFAIRGVMVFGPRRVVSVAWPEELAKWDNLSHLTHILCREDDVKTRIAMLRSRSDFYLLNYDLMPWWCDWVMKEVKIRPLMFDMLILDESSCLRTASSARFKELKPIADSDLFPRIIELTGTPAPEEYENLWSQFRLLDGGGALEPFITHFRKKYIDSNPYCRFETSMKPGAASIIEERIAPLTVTVLADEFLDLPPCMEHTIYVTMPAEAVRIYEEFEQTMVADIQSEVIAAPSAAQVTEKCRQVVSGAVYTPGAEGNETLRLHEAKFDALDEIIESTGENILCAYWYRHEMETIRKRYPTAPILGPNLGEKEMLRVVRDWNAGKIKLLFAHPSSVGHGINLQHGGRHLVYLTCPWPNDLFRQMNGRLHRMGQTKPVMVHKISVKDTVDDDVTNRLTDKEIVQRAMRRALSRLNPL